MKMINKEGNCIKDVVDGRHADRLAELGFVPLSEGKITFLSNEKAGDGSKEPEEKKKTGRPAKT